MIETIEAGDRRVVRRAVVNAPIDEIFAMVSNPHRHGELDGSGSVGSNVSGPESLAPGDTFTTKMRMFGINYQTTSTTTHVEDRTVVEWQLGAGQKWRWELRELSPSSTEVTETWDITEVPGVMATAFKLGGMFGRNARGIEATLQKLQDQFA